MVKLFKPKDKSTKKSIIIDIIYMVLLIIFVKIPFDIMKDIGNEFIDILTNNLFSKLWDLRFTLLYLIAVLSVLLFFKKF